MLTLDDFDFELPAELIAQQPAAERSGSRLLRLLDTGISDHRFDQLPALLDAGDLLVFNDARVIRGRMFGRKASGGRIEVLFERIIDARHALAQIRASKSPKPGSRILLEEAIPMLVGERSGEQGEFVALELAADGDLWSLVERHGRLPLPPYIKHVATAADEARYQTVFARSPGAVAAPTAGLHFDQALLQQLAGHGVGSAWLTLHVGAGTFQPVRAHDLREHRMHSERFELPAATVAAIARTRSSGGRVVAVGTTSLRALEAAARWGELRAGADETDLFITPGYEFRVVDRLLTNFHLPRSTLLMLVAAFAGHASIRSAYEHAIRKRYRFFSYGDAMLLTRQCASPLRHAI
ncbi:tRNA preQ1(34) S-adenosylmethionine ribosyltransferase-isomerase QueA [Accumulibacter sp.]|uniref:tRNA preQ1(34) S-adenosylmethionine ribosyltransferase-isomerase QueA n=1 Tax=Accumulibacter sp. TaxID=2053492 RepID=UPI0025DF5D16|nr:tRNA preQ1(34) S-adenosylmethionine ribosyltransferase-isomerase QueA [Accumulibacter sp.]MCM8611720.1 tRNA preQ1(34) S-adenosylmethionine ribosyltransferase-isomerase QueA [Accumulibacter sp.]MCM8635449.1 tRNA preQ1(34) S-adenosylmethionine ribosyltransferase-isomerase QueA [Accumulibacter sp.]MCM8639189.1 tRNA preQ1(34) S-adenosylmethionine ribosyltransferase-isomerase QueA [Accumulibacter sp.]